jgi:nitrogen regulatory protein PII
MDDNETMKALFMIVNAGFVEEVMEIARAAGIRGATILNARGESARHKSILGITVNTEKEVILSIVDEYTAEKVMAAVKEKAGIGTIAHSVCFVMPVEKIIGISMPVTLAHDPVSVLREIRRFDAP